MSLFKKKPEPRKYSPRPKLRPAGFNPTGGGDDPKSVAGSSGKGGGGQSAKPKYNPKAPSFKTQMKFFNEKGNINNDGEFGYGYIDEETGIQVPWYIDMINGGGANAAGDTFVSPYEGSMAGLPAQAVTGALNEMNIAPYGSNRSRYYMPKQAEGDTQTAAPRGNGRKNSGPIQAPTQDFSNLSNAPDIRKSLIGYSPQVVSGALPQPVVQGGVLQPMSAAISDTPPDVDPAFGTDPSMAVSRLRKDLAVTVPQEFIGTDIDKLYQYYLQGGGTQNFAAFAQGAR